MNWTPQFQQDNSEAEPPPPPPVPPKMTTQDWDEFLSDRDQVTQPDSSAPPLPPKPWLVYLQSVIMPCCSNLALFSRKMKK